MLTKTEINRMATLMAKASADDIRLIAGMAYEASKAKTRNAARSLSVGDTVERSGKRVRFKRGFMTRTVEKVNRKNIVVNGSARCRCNIASTANISINLQVDC